METVTNLTTAASRAIWGGEGETKPDPNKTEPVSGELGNVKAGEPYDKGNAEPETEQSTRVPNTDVAHDAQVSRITPSENASANNTSSTTDTANLKQTSDLASEEHTTEHQGAGWPEKMVNSDEHARIPAPKKDAKEAASIDVSGPGPKTLEEKFKSSGGQDAEVDGSQKESHGEGTGEKYVESSGVRADGGDFDASNPGAGKEADRLLEEKGFHHNAKEEADQSSKPTSGDTKDTTSTPGKEKVSLKDKIKAKLHRSKDN